jgi:dTMP kinase
LADRLKKAGEKVRTIDFPRYYDNFFGKFIGECLAGRHGNFAALDPKIASVLYAADRFESSKQIREWLEQGNIVIADRYVSANQMHQGGKIQDDENRKAFLDWLDKMEYEVFRIPRPDLIIYLDVTVDISRKLSKRTSGTEKKAYLQGEQDVCEVNTAYLSNARASALQLVQANNNWFRIDCAPDGKMLTKEEINDMIWKIITK